MIASESRVEFLGDGDERNHLSDTIAFYLPSRDPYSEELKAALVRLQMLLEQRGGDDGSIMLQIHWSEYYEAMGQFESALLHRKRGIELIERLFEIGDPVGTIDFQFLHLQMQALARYYHKLGDESKAADFLKRAKDIWHDDCQGSAIN